MKEFDKYWFNTPTEPKKPKKKTSPGPIVHPVDMEGAGRGGVSRLPEPKK